MLKKGIDLEKELKEELWVMQKRIWYLQDRSRVKRVELLKDRVLDFVGIVGV